MAGEGAPLTKDLNVEVDAAATAADVLVTIEAPYAGTLTGAEILPTAALTGANTNSRTITVTNRGTGAGTTVMATLAFVSGVNLAADTAQSLTLSVVAGALTVAEGDVIEVASLHVGTGLAAPAFDCELTFSRVSGS
jgi:hypothetical protein